jgi:hypothetical protein
LVYDRREARTFPTQVKSAGNICNFYPPELEKYLSEDIENPANRVLDKARNRESLAPSENIRLSKYISVMRKRFSEGNWTD